MNKNELHGYLKHRCRGADHAVSAGILCRLMCMGESDLRKYVNQLRREGVPIGSGPRGYYYAQTAGELYQTIKNLKKMADGLNAAIAGLEKSFARFTEAPKDGDAHE